MVALEINFGKIIVQIVQEEEINGIKIGKKQIKNGMRMHNEEEKQMNLTPNSCWIRRGGSFHARL